MTTGMEEVDTVREEPEEGASPDSRTSSLGKRSTA
jgi:hypothetical protein